ncbi:MAG TPA: MarR family transcriptional regulator [Glycomyces sp.]|nr:MarR family transcriptional regulator [Glycomyces sp.]
MAGPESQHPAASPEALAFVEDFALTFERLGLVRMTGRVMGWLLIADPPEQTFADIAEVLQASKGSISTALKFLTTARWVDKTSKPGDRKDYYTIRPGVMPDLIKQQSAQYSRFTETLSQGFALFEGPDAPGAERLRDMHDFFAWMEKELPALMERWDREQR